MISTKTATILFLTQHLFQCEILDRLLVFGAGRRVCLGETFAKNRLYLFVTVLLQRFTFVPEDPGTLPEADPRSYDLGLVLHPKPFRVKAIIREQKS